jgi:isoaspartyl peptidase/L-asparaginase-like protein (Ntn-hydrolase superfamily)
VFTRDGRHELEASIMTSDRRCGAATLLTRVRNPIRLARAVMSTPHVLLGGAQAESLAEQACTLVDLMAVCHTHGTLLEG